MPLIPILWEIDEMQRRGKGLIDSDRRGSFTVELALVFPVVMIGIVATLYIILLLYQYAFLQALANRTAYRAAAEYAAIGSIGGMEEDFKLLNGERGAVVNKGLYWQLGIFDDNEGKERIIEAYAKEGFKGYQPLKLHNSSVEASVSNYILYKNLKIRIVAEYRLPVFYVNNALGLKSSFQIIAEGEAMIKDNAEIIRNTDYLIELMDRTEVTSSLKNSYTRMLETWSRGVNDILNE